MPIDDLPSMPDDYDAEKEKNTISDLPSMPENYGKDESSISKFLKQSLNLPEDASNADILENATSTAVNPFGNLVKGAKYVAGKLPIGSDLAKSGIETSEDALTGAQEGVTAGLRDELLGGIKGAGRTAAEALTGELPKEKSTIEELMANYEKYRDKERDVQKAAKERSPYAHFAGELGGMVVPVGGAFKALSAPSKMVAGVRELSPAVQALKTFGGMGKAAEYIPAALRTSAAGAIGAIQGYGQSEGKTPEETAKDTAVGGVMGAALNPALEGAGNLIGKGLGKAYDLAKDVTYTKQLAATLKNAREGGSFFKQSTADIIPQESEALADKIASSTMAPIAEQNRVIDRQLDEAVRQGQLLKPNDNQNFISNDFKNNIQQFFPGAYEKQITNLQSGTMNPKEALRFRRELKNFADKLFNTSELDPKYTDLGHYIQDSGIIKQLEELSASAGTDIKQLNADKEQAWKLVEPFIQKLNKFVPEEEHIFASASDWDSNKLNLRIRDTLNKVMNTAGKSVAEGGTARNTIQDLLAHYKNIQGKINTGINPEQVVQQMREQSYVNAAHRTAQGYRESGINMNFLESAFHKAPHLLMEGAGKAEKFLGGNQLRDLSAGLVKSEPIQVERVNGILKSNPATSHIADEYYNAMMSKDNAKKNAAIFSIMQNPIAKKLLGYGGEENEGK